jgi:hypothetical protein
MHLFDWNSSFISFEALPFGDGVNAFGYEESKDRGTSALELY